MAEGGLIDDTRIDLSQLDESNRSQPSTPLRRSPTGPLLFFPPKPYLTFHCNWEEELLLWYSPLLLIKNKNFLQLTWELKAALAPVKVTPPIVNLQQSW